MRSCLGCFRSSSEPSGSPVRPCAAKATRRAGSQAKRLWREEDPKAPQGLKKNRLPGIGPHVDCFVFGLETLDLVRGAGPEELKEQRALFTGNVGGQPTSRPRQP